IVLDRSVDPRFRNECDAAVGECSVAQFLDFMRRRKFRLKSLLQVSLRVGGDSALCQIESERRRRCYYYHDRREQSGAKARDLLASRRNRGAHGKSTCSV